MGITDICCESEMSAARVRCDSGGVDACLVVLPRWVPDDKPSWDAGTDAPGKGRVPSLLIAEAATPYVLRVASDAGYHAVIPSKLSSRMLYRCISALLQDGRRQAPAAAEPGRRPRPRIRSLGRTLAGDTVNSGKLKLQ
jgi:hypothetical protein